MKIPGKDKRLEFFKKLYDEARAALSEEFELLDRHYEQYKGSTAIDPKPGDTEAPEPATVVRNITYELIESQITTYVPTPKCEPVTRSDRGVYCAMSAERLLKTLRDRLPCEELTDLSERYTPIYGASIWLVEWDESIRAHNTVGGVKLSCLSPKRFVCQPYVYNPDDAEYLFLEFETTREDLERKYGVSLEVTEETSNDKDADDKTATQYVCYFKNDDDEICQYIWSGNVELLYSDNYYSRKREYCKKCGKRREICECENAEYEVRDDENEELDAPITLSDGQTVIPAEVQKIGEDGMPVFKEESIIVHDEAGGLMMERDALGMTLPVTETIQVPVMEKTKLPFYKPKSFPIVIQKNTSREDSVLGQSDCEFIRPQQQAINKIESRIVKKLMNAGVTPYIPDDANVSLTNRIFGECLKIRREDIGLYGVIDTQVSIQSEMAESERLYDQAKRILGISDSFQGHYDGSAKSGVAKQQQVMQSAGRLDSKRQMKNSAWARMDRIIFELYLAFADEPRPTAYRDAYGNLQESTFSRYDYLVRDDDGSFYYDDEYTFSADASADISNQRELLWQENRLNFEKGAYGDPMDSRTQLIFWMNMMRAHYPFAQDNVDRVRERIAEEGQMAMMQKTIDNLAADNANRAAYEQQILGQARDQQKELGRYKQFAKYTDQNIERRREAARQQEAAAAKMQ